MHRGRLGEIEIGSRSRIGKHQSEARQAGVWSLRTEGGIRITGSVIWCFGATLLRASGVNTRHEDVYNVLGWGWFFIQRYARGVEPLETKEAGVEMEFSKETCLLPAGGRGSLCIRTSGNSDM